MIRVPVKPQLLRWARHRAGLGRNEFPARFKKRPEWETGRLQPTPRRLEDFARQVHVPVGTLLLRRATSASPRSCSCSTFGRRASLTI